MLLAVPDFCQAICLHLGLLQYAVPGWGPRIRGGVVMAFSVALGMPVWVIWVFVVAATLALVVLGAAPSVFSAAVMLALVVVMGTSVWMVLHLMWHVDGPPGPFGTIRPSRAVCLLRRSLRSP